MRSVIPFCILIHVYSIPLLFISRLACVKTSVCLALPSFLLERRAEHLSLFASVFTGAARQFCFLVINFDQWSRLVGEWWAIGLDKSSSLFILHWRRHRRWAGEELGADHGVDDGGWGGHCLEALLLSNVLLPLLCCIKSNVRTGGWGLAKFAITFF